MEVQRAKDNVTLIRIIAGVLTVFVFLPLIVIPFWKIFSKAGFSGALSLLMLVPLANITVNGPVQFAIEKDRLYVRSEDGSEHETRIIKKILKTQQPAANPASKSQ